MKKTFLCAAFFSVFSFTSHSEPLYLTQCTTTQTCADTVLQNKSLEIANGRESNVLVFDNSTRDTYHYHVVDVSGDEFPLRPILVSRKVASVDASVKEAVANFSDVQNNGIGMALGSTSNQIGRVAGWPVYSTNGIVSSSFSAGDLQYSMNNIWSQISAAISDEYNSSIHSVTDSLNIALTGSIGTFLSATIGFQADNTATVILQFPKKDNGVGYGMVTKFTKNGFNIDSVIQSIVLIENGEVILTIPVNNNVVDFNSLMGTGFTTSNYGSVRAWLQNYNLDLRLD